MRRPVRGDTGTSFLEYAAVVMLVALLVAAVLRVSPPDNVAGGVREAMCNALNEITGEQKCGDGDGGGHGGNVQGDGNGGDDGNGAGQGDGDSNGNNAVNEPNFDPELCIREGHNRETGAELDLGFFTLGKKYHYAKETLSDGTVRVTMLPKLEAGAAGKAGGGIEFGENSLNKETGAGIDGKLGEGNRFFLRGEHPGETGEQQFERLEDDIAQAQREDMEDMSGDPGYQMGRLIGEVTDTYEPPDLPPVDVKMGTYGLESEAEAPINRWRSDNGAIPEGNLELGNTVDVQRWYDDPDNTKTSRTYTYSGEGDLGIDRMGAHINSGLSWSGANRVMRNEDGSLKNIRYSTTASGNWKAGVGNKGQHATGKGKVGGKQAVTQEVQIDFTTPEEQAMGERLLEERGLLPPENVMASMANPLMDAEKGGDITQPPGEDAKPYEQLFYDKGRVWQYQSDVDKEEIDFGAKAKLGISVGASFGWSNEHSSATDAQILEGPQNGERRFVTHEPCIAPEHRGGD